MLPTAIVNSPIPVPLVNTTLPGTAVMHVPYDNVAPSISNAQVNNNASPNSEAASAEEQSETTQAQADNEEQAATSPSAAQPQALSAQAAFLAQLLSQDGSPETQTILVQYEKLAALSNVKYKPSNASKPIPEPSSVFGKILQENRAPALTQAVAPPRGAVSSPAQPSPSLEEEAAFSAPAPAQPPHPQPRATSSTNSAVGQTDAYASYASSAARVDIQNTEVTGALA